MKISKANAEHYLWGGDCDGWHLVKNQNLSVIHERMPSGGRSSATITSSRASAFLC